MNKVDEMKKNSDGSFELSIRAIRKVKDISNCYDENDKWVPVTKDQQQQWHKDNFEEIAARVFNDHMVEKLWQPEYRSTIPCDKGSDCSWPACELSCTGRPGSPL